MRSSVYCGLLARKRSKGRCILTLLIFVVCCVDGCFARLLVAAIITEDGVFGGDGDGGDCGERSGDFGGVGGTGLVGDSDILCFVNVAVRTTF